LENLCRLKVLKVIHAIFNRIKKRGLRVNSIRNGCLILIKIKKFKNKKNYSSLLTMIVFFIKQREKFNSVRVEFIPTNTTSQLQPIDQGIIQNFIKSYIVNKPFTKWFIILTNIIYIFLSRIYSMVCKFKTLYGETAKTFSRKHDQANY